MTAYAYRDFQLHSAHFNDLPDENKLVNSRRQQPLAISHQTDSHPMIDNYSVDSFGVIHQIEFQPIQYDQDYISYYENLSDRTIKLGYQRLGWILGMLDRVPDSVLEIGYGTGTFIEAAQITGVARCVGCDIADYPLPQGVAFMDWENSLKHDWDVVAMFDVLRARSRFKFSARVENELSSDRSSVLPLARVGRRVVSRLADAFAKRASSSF